VIGRDRFKDSRWSLFAVVETALDARKAESASIEQATTVVDGTASRDRPCIRACRRDCHEEALQLDKQGFSGILVLVYTSIQVEGMGCAAY
jgi:hypothetical protein